VEQEVIFVLKLFESYKFITIILFLGSY